MALDLKAWLGLRALGLKAWGLGLSSVGIRDYAWQV